MCAKHYWWGVKLLMCLAGGGCLHFLLNPLLHDQDHYENRDMGTQTVVLFEKSGKNMNSIITIHPYKHRGLWVFDDDSVGLLREPFVSGADVIIDRLVEAIPNAEQGFTLLFSAYAFPGYQAELEWRREDGAGNWYYSPALDAEGWLCPALFNYFEQAPKKIYVQCMPERP